MSQPPTVKPTHKPVKQYYEALAGFAAQGVGHEMAVRSAFQHLLEETGRKAGWTLIPELSVEGRKGTVRPDGTFRDDFQMRRAYWEAKDTADDLEAEVRKKIARGYPLTNTIFEDTREGLLYQNGQLAMRADLTEPAQLCDLLNALFSFTEPAHEDFDKAIDEFSERVPELARGLVAKIEEAHRENRPFQKAFADFFEVCRVSLNPNLSQAAVDEMLVQHLLTERLIRTIFDRQDFVRRNVIAAEVEKVVDALVSRSFSRHEFLKSLDRFYLAIEEAAGTIGDFSEKQHFLNSIYERFFQGYSVKVADTMGIVYTPQEIVDFMCASVEEVLRDEFGKDLGSPGVNILDPCTGTGNFLVNLIRRIPKRHLRRVYHEQLFANEVMLMPYYIAALNIEHAYYERTGEYEPFEGLCFVDTLDLAEAKQGEFAFMSEENTERVERQKGAEITVIIGNPPYNVGQLNENDNNKNRKYDVIDGRIRESYASASSATNKNKLWDMYVKFFRWAVDRLQGRDGIVCFVSNNSFLDTIAFDGMRRHMLLDFSRIYHVDLHGNVRRNPKLSGTTHNVFGIQVGVGITVAVRRGATRENCVRYHRVPEDWRKETKLLFLQQKDNVTAVDWAQLVPDPQDNWVQPGESDVYAKFLSIGSPAAKRAPEVEPDALFSVTSMGIQTNKDTWLYDFQRRALEERVPRFIETYNSEIDRWKRAGRPKDIDSFVIADVARIKWCSRLKENLAREKYAEFSQSQVRRSAYRPFTDQYVYFDPVLIHRQGVFTRIFPTVASEKENRSIGVTDIGSEKPFMVLATNSVSELHLVGAGCGTQCFPFYVYDEDGTNRRENVTDWALGHFRGHYRDKKISKWDIFHYVYGVLHHPGYRERFAENLKRELPRVPLAPDFRAFADAGRELAGLHLGYEELEPYELDWLETPDVPLAYRVEKMRLSKDKTQLRVNDSLTLGGIPAEVFAYKLGNRSALEWVIDQYRVKTDKRSGITSDPNRPDDPEYIVRLVGQVVRVSLETVRIVGGLAEDYGAAT